MIQWHPEHEAVAFIKDRVEAALGNDLPGGVHHGMIPQEAVLPAVRVNFFLRRNNMTNSQEITMSTLRCFIFAVVPGGDIEVLQDISGRMCEALHKASGSGAGSPAHVLACTYLEPATMTEGDRGSIVRHSGGVFELLLQIAP